MNTLEHHTPPSAEQASLIARDVLLAREALDYGTDALPHDITERLRAARVRALSAPKKSVQATPRKSTFNFGSWYQHLSSWMRSGIAVGAVAVAFILTLGTTQSDLNSASQQANAQGNSQALQANSSVQSASLTSSMSASGIMSALPTLNKDTNGKTTVTKNKNPSGAARVLLAADAVSANPEDEQVDIILREKIPLQAYLNEDFNQFTERHAESNSTPNSTQPQ